MSLWLETKVLPWIIFLSFILFKIPCTWQNQTNKARIPICSLQIYLFLPNFCPIFSKLTIYLISVIPLIMWLTGHHNMVEYIAFFLVRNERIVTKEKMGPIQIQFSGVFLPWLLWLLFQLDIWFTISDTLSLNL